MGKVLAGVSGMSTFVLALLGIAAAVYFVTPLRAKAYRIFIKLFAKHVEDAKAHELREKVGLSEGDVNMGELLDEKSKIAGGETSAVESVVGGELKSR
ncbi:hypothetical protein FIBSPDRAFT_1053389 [Athelia psychrophila]|uniref:Uncharacterized protein n=1 Tax=Athelia psychrophila TaxID=1759441 RepID=A0A167WX71_9AGAM|nr:hypothetical protein FIBSPDRAFT_1053479 [Fibularhizoctonia sp. CBS 109695]KZP06699.1 hypothetical protein FIBSPDRAFT_1053389 [Fibularhizoctonia sp. CBS 109695]